MLGYYGRIAALVRAKLGDHPLVRELLATLAEINEAAGLPAGEAQPRDAQ